jgi:alanine dehydrogenase
MRVFDAREVAERLDHAALVEALLQGFRRGCTAPVRHHHPIETPGGPPATLLLMPAWRSGGPMGVKVATVFPGNAAAGLPTVHAWYLLFRADTGEPLALLEGGELTARRTAAASALASRLLSREESRCLLVMGTGRLAPHLVAAHATQRPLERVLVWGRSPEKALALAGELRDAGFDARAVTDLAAAIAAADIISCATLAREPILAGRHLRPGQHVDLVGGFTPEMREADDDVMTRGAIFVDTRAGALAEAGDLVQPIARGVIGPASIRGDLYDLARGDHPGRSDAAEITVFKSVGTALEDLVAAELVAAELVAAAHPAGPG